MAAAKRAAFFEPLTAMQATGTPGGIWAMESKASRPDTAVPARRGHGDADDGQACPGGDDAGGGGQPCRRRR